MMMPRKMMTLRKVNETYYMNEDGDFVRKFNGDNFWTVAVGDKVEAAGTMQDAMKAFARIVERR